MFKRIVRNLALASTLTLLSATAAHASVTGTDPVPTSPDVISIVLAVLHLA